MSLKNVEKTTSKRLVSSFGVPSSVGSRRKSNRRLTKGKTAVHNARLVDVIAIIVEPFEKKKKKMMPTQMLERDRFKTIVFDLQRLIDD